MINITCPGCSTALQVHDQQAGTNLKCPMCECLNRAPGIASSAGMPPLPPPPPPPPSHADSGRRESTICNDLSVVHANVAEQGYVQDENGQRFVNFYCGRCRCLQHFPASVIGQQVECVQCGVLNQLPHDVAQGAWKVLKGTGKVIGGIFGAIGSLVGAYAELEQRACPNCGHPYSEMLAAMGAVGGPLRCRNCNLILPR